MISVKVITTTELANGDLEIVLEYNSEFAKFLKKKYKCKRISVKLVQDLLKEALEQYKEEGLKILNIKKIER